jgi:hypothetical protein
VARTDARAHIAALAAVAVGGCVIPLLAAWHYHTFGAARGDDWSYLRTEFHWIATGHLDFNHWVSMTLLGQLVLTAPIALVHHGDTTALQIGTALIGLAGLLAVEWVAFTFTRGAGRAAFVALTVAAGPMWGILAVSYMTDVPAFAFTMLSMAFGVRALRNAKPSIPFVLATVALGYVAFTIREYAGVPAAAILVVVAFQARRSGDRRTFVTMLATGIAAAVGVVVFLVVWRMVPHAKELHPSLPTHHAISTLIDKGAGMYRLAGLWLAPLLVFRRPARIVRDAWHASAVATVATVVVVGGWLAVTAARLPRLGFAGNYFVPNGALGDGVSSGHRPLLIPTGWFDALVVLGTLAAVLLAVLAVPTACATVNAIRRRDATMVDRSPARTFVGACAVLYAAAYAVAAITGLPLYDRYTMPIVGILCVLVVPRVAAGGAMSDRDRRVPTLRWRDAAASAVTFALLAGIGLLYTLDSASFDAVRWNVSEMAVHAGWRPDAVGGNFEWVNYHSSDPGTRLIPRSPCVLVVVGTATADQFGTVIARGTYRPPLHSAVPVLAVRTRQKCAAPSSAPHAAASG